MKYIEYELYDIFSLLLWSDFHNFGNDILYLSLIEPLSDIVTDNDINDYIQKNYQEYSDTERQEYTQALKSLFTNYSSDDTGNTNNQ